MSVIGEDLRLREQKEGLIHFRSVKSTSEAEQLIGRKVAWPKGERKCVRKILALLAKKGLAKDRFRKGLPGKVVSSQVKIVG